MTDSRRETHDYRSGRGLLHEGVVNRDGSPEELWNSADAAERGCNSRMAREIRPALPAELPLAD